jgi:hypothetical protein
MLSKPRDVIQVIVRDLICLNSSNSTLFPFAVYSAASMHALTSLYESTSDVTSHVILNKIDLHKNMLKREQISKLKN